MHKTLERQLVRFFGSLEKTPKELEGLLEMISETYKNNNQEYQLMERALDISSEELSEVNAFLRREKEEIEERVKARTKELSKERKKLDYIAQNMTIGAILLDKEKKVVFINNAALKILNIEDGTSDTVLETFFEMFDGLSLREILAKDVLREEKKISEAVVDDLFYEISIQDLLEGENDQEETFGHIIWIRDITEEKNLERSKSELISVVSHQLRTPLTVTKGNSEMLLDELFGALNEEQKDIVKQTAESNNRLIELVNKMLDASRIEQQKPNYATEKISFAEVVERVIKSLQVYADMKGIEIRYSKDENASFVVHGDEGKLYQVIQNLVENAIKYGENVQGENVVEISLDCPGDVVKFTVTDHGIGIPKNEYEKIYERFFRAKNAVAHIIEGTGLGLYIAKSIVESMGGKITFSSEVDVGSVFEVCIPRARE